uniref:Methanol dehydrogenase n=1 Tax=Ascaris lumbricoides TaxID=6252 RepID=A0A0M3HIY8_ASCLU
FDRSFIRVVSGDRGGGSGFRGSPRGGGFKSSFELLIS